MAFPSGFYSSPSDLHGLVQDFRGAGTQIESLQGAGQVCQRTPMSRVVSAKGLDRPFSDSDGVGQVGQLTRAREAGVQRAAEIGQPDREFGVALLRVLYGQHPDPHRLVQVFHGPRPDEPHPQHVAEVRLQPGVVEVAHGSGRQREGPGLDSLIQVGQYAVAPEAFHERDAEVRQSLGVVGMVVGCASHGEGPVPDRPVQVGRCTGVFEPDQQRAAERMEPQGSVGIVFNCAFHGHGAYADRLVQVVECPCPLESATPYDAEHGKPIRPIRVVLPGSVDDALPQIDRARSKLRIR